ncbi:MAG: 30S ribosomal protein S12 methylthiotransferase RimO [Planctomycetaceae bacterium]|jgi:ribosomal protein S12 methylthiotransferase|nr:30S ribosomal protein S12 methylthiotransferase RimO [Planctomycetaceae bacterium]
MTNHQSNLSLPYKSESESKSESRSVTFSIVSLGCPKNLVDSEYYVREMCEQGYKFLVEPDGCDVVVLNTCGFLQSARDEARDYISGLVEMKNSGRIKRIIVRGCMTQHEGKSKLAAEFPDVDEWHGIPSFRGQKVNLNNAINLPISQDVLVADSEQAAQVAVFGLGSSGFGREILTYDHVAYLRIADGCSRGCSFCTIPSIRGRYRSEALGDLLFEAKELAARGVKELIVIAQETTFWGMDLPERQRLVDLLRELETVDGIRWIRLMYAYPAFFDAELISHFAQSEKLLPYIDIPLQHINDTILQQMNRQVTRKETELLLDNLRNEIKDVVLRTSFIVGFPGETDVMFDELVKFVDKWRFERAGVFAFSPEKGTPAANIKKQIPRRIINQRLNRLKDTCAKQTAAYEKKQKGTIINVQIDNNFISEDGHIESNLFVGRTYADAPDIDPVVFVTSGKKLSGGEIVACEILEVDGSDLVGIAL